MAQPSEATLRERRLAALFPSSQHLGSFVDFREKDGLPKVERVDSEQSEGDLEESFARAVMFREARSASVESDGLRRLLDLARS